MTDTSDEDEYDYREANVYGPGGELRAAVIRTPTPRTPAPLPSLPKFEPCRRGCPDGECCCAEPMVGDFLFPDGDGDWAGDYD